MTVYIVGLDGATFDLIDQWEDHLPNLRELKEAGAYGELETVTPPITPAAWSTFLTGKNPGKHGIYDFSVRVPDSTNEFALVSYDDLGTETFYHHLNRHGLRVGSFNIPVTYPPPDIDGYVISGEPVAEFGPHATVPEELWEGLDALGLSRETVDYTGENEEAFIASQTEQLDTFEEAFFHLLDTQDVDVHTVLFQNTDTLSHWMWKYHDDDHPDHPEERAEYGDSIRQIYMKADRIVGRIRDRMDDDDYLVILSDHGFGGVHKSLYVNNLFHEEGLLQFKRTPGTLVRRLLFRLGIDMELANRIGTRLGLKHQARKSQKKGNGGGLLVRLVKAFLLSEDDIDWDRTVAWSRGNFGQVFLRDDLDGEEREAVIDTVTDVLRGLEDPDTGERIVDEVLRKEELYHGPRTGRAPDLVFMTNGLRYLPARHFEFGSRKIVSDAPVRNGHHRMNGIFYISGPDIQDGTELEGCDIADVAPTVIHALGLPVPAAMDGAVITDAFQTEQTVDHVDTRDATGGIDI